MGYNASMLLLRDLPRYEAIRQQAERYPQIDPRAVESFLVLLRTATDVGDSFTDYLARHGMSQGRFTVLMILNRAPKEGVSPSSLADRAGVTRATITGLLDGLERENLIRRQGDAHDRRRAVVFLMPPGQKILDSILPDYYRRISQLMGGVEEADKQRLTELLVKIGKGLSEL